MVLVAFAIKRTIEVIFLSFRMNSEKKMLEIVQENARKRLSSIFQ